MHSHSSSANQVLLERCSFTCLRIKWISERTTKRSCSLLRTTIGSRYSLCHFPALMSLYAELCRSEYRTHDSLSAITKTEECVSKVSRSYSGIHCKKLGRLKIFLRIGKMEAPKQQIRSSSVEKIGPLPRTCILCQSNRFLVQRQWQCLERLALSAR